MSLADRLWALEPKKKTQAQIQIELETIISDLVKIDSRIEVYVFGSTAKGNASVESDIDIAVIVPDDIDLKTFKSNFYAKKKLMSVPVDFIFRTESEYKYKINNNQIDYEINLTGVQLYPKWDLE